MAPLEGSPLQSLRVLFGLFVELRVITLVHYWHPSTYLLGVPYYFAVDEVVDSGMLKRILAQTEITFSNSMIESWCRVLKRQWLYLNTLDTVSTVRKLVAFYAEQHNSRLPHSAFMGHDSA